MRATHISNYFPIRKYLLSLQYELTFLKISTKTREKRLMSTTISINDELGIAFLGERTYYL